MVIIFITMLAWISWETISLSVANRLSALLTSLFVEFFALTGSLSYLYSFSWRE